MKCSVENCNQLSHCKGFCERHYRQTLKGKLNTNTESRKDPNKFTVIGDICYISLYDKDRNEIAKAKIDTKYYEQIKNSNLKWFINSRGYVRAKYVDAEGNHHISLHKAIIQLSGQDILENNMIDHKDRNKLNCLEENLRICNAIQNAQNVGIRKDNNSGFKGVSWSKNDKKYTAYIQINHVRKHLGYFNTADEAAKAYNDAAKKHFGDFAALNNI